MSNPELTAYLALERKMVNLDDLADVFADELRDRMDPIWLCLTDSIQVALPAVVPTEVCQHFRSYTRLIH